MFYNIFLIALNSFRHLQFKQLSVCHTPRKCSKHQVNFSVVCAMFHSRRGNWWMEKEKEVAIAERETKLPYTDVTADLDPPGPNPLANMDRGVHFWRYPNPLGHRIQRERCCFCNFKPSIATIYSRRNFNQAKEIMLAWSWDASAVQVISVGATCDCGRLHVIRLIRGHKFNTGVWLLSKEGSQTDAIFYSERTRERTYRWSIIKPQR